MTHPHIPGPILIEFEGKKPTIHPDAWVAPGAILIGDVTIGKDSSVFYGCVLRGDIAPIRIGQRTNIQDNCTVHVDADAPCTLGDDVTVGHMAMLHGTTVEDGCLVGMKSTLLSHSTIGQGALVAAGAVVAEHATVEPQTLVAGVPAKPRRELSDEQSHAFIPHAGRYVDLSKRHAQAISTQQG